MFNKKGQQIFVGIMIMIMVFIVIVQFITPIKDQITTARSPGALDCGNSTISVATKATCIIIDWTLFYYVGIGIAVGAGFLGGLAIKRKLSPSQ